MTGAPFQTTGFSTCQYVMTRNRWRNCHIDPVLQNAYHYRDSHRQESTSEHSGLFAYKTSAGSRLLCHVLKRKKIEPHFKWFCKYLLLKNMNLSNWVVHRSSSTFITGTSQTSPVLVRTAMSNCEHKFIIFYKYFYQNCCKNWDSNLSIDTVYQWFVFYVVIPDDGPRGQKQVVTLSNNIVVLTVLMSFISYKNKTQRDVRTKYR